ncbi:uncharacterized protein EI97DRAFT_431197 [Westerdykella ornata]|uniref:Uncharacterized protein n=1 Tax=Westerdykella ornata TaxID=318751 RepID=A0A6A6JRU2_WESOR|nr:uncharacterized protein EI97DRAFT_431197 [Westerdykella ornata]KAF2278975.1 hypothetical protein EI97DRAFT_431197 [Westerdykella ornata]
MDELQRRTNHCDHCGIFATYVQHLHGAIAEKDKQVLSLAARHRRSEVNLQMSRLDLYKSKTAMLETLQKLEVQIREMQQSINQLANESKEKDETINRLECAFTLLYELPRGGVTREA